MAMLEWTLLFIIPLLPQWYCFHVIISSCVVHSKSILENRNRKHNSELDGFRFNKWNFAIGQENSQSTQCFKIECYRKEVPTVLSLVGEYYRTSLRLRQVMRYSQVNRTSLKTKSSEESFLIKYYYHQILKIENCYTRPSNPGLQLAPVICW